MFRLLLALSVAACLAAPARAATVWDGVYSADQAARGAALYADRCAECHGGNMEGSMNAPPLAGLAFAYVWDGMPLSELFTFTRTTMPPNQVGTVSDAQVADILASVLAANAFPAGETALPADPQALGVIAFQRAQ